MRISSTMMTGNYLKQLNGTYEQYTKLMEQSDGSKLHRSSDNAVGYSKYLRFQNSLSTNGQFQGNVKTAISWMKTADSTLVNVTNLLQTFKAKVEQASNSTNNASDMKDIAKELLSSVQEQVADMNAQVGDRYLFSGQSDTTMPFRITDDKKDRGETKTLDEAQASFFSDVNTGGQVTQMLKLTGNDGNDYYMNTQNGYIFTADFVNNGYKNETTYNAATQSVGQDASFKVADHFDKYGVKTADYTTTVNGVELSLATTKQYIVEYHGDSKYISMVKKTGGVDQATDAINVTGQDVWGTDIFDCDNDVASGTAMLNQLLYSVAKIDSNDYHWAGSDGMTIADAAHASVLGSQTKMAARHQAYTASTSMLTTQNEAITGDISDVSSTDVAYLATKLMEYQTIYSMSLSVGAKILPGSLADYLN